MMNQISNRIKSILARGIIHLVADEAGRQQCQISILEGEVKAKVERTQMFGFSSFPPSGTACVIGFIGGDRSKPVILGDNAGEFRHKGIESGGAVSYDEAGQYIILNPVSGNIEIKTNGLLTIKSADKVRVETDMLECTGEIKDRCDDGDGMTMRGMRDVFNIHTHDENDEHSHSPTDEPNQKMEGDGS